MQTIPQEHNKFKERQGSRVHSGLQAHTTGQVQVQVQVQPTQKIAKHRQSRDLQQANIIICTQQGIAPKVQGISNNQHPHNRAAIP
jgi:hypothetical protein